MKKNLFINKKISFALLLLSMTAILPSCSVAMAANKSGTNVDKIEVCRTRGNFLNIASEVLSTNKTPEGDIVEIYKIQQERGSAARAFMHGVLDVSTLGVWEAIGTPIEATLDKKKFYSVKVTYNEDETVKRVELI